TTTAATASNVFICPSPSFAYLVIQKRAPGGLAYVPCLHRQALLHLAVARNGRQRPAVVGLRCIQNQLTVRHETGRFVALSFGERLPLLARQIERLQLETPAVACNIDQGFAIARDPRRYIVAAVEGYARGLPAARAHAVDLGAAAAIGSEVYRLAI